MAKPVPIDERTSGRGYKKPHADNLMSDDVVRVAEALDQVDRDVTDHENYLQRIKMDRLLGLNID